MTPAIRTTYESESDICEVGKRGRGRCEASISTVELINNSAVR
jgi:hypothetical protein